MPKQWPDMSHDADSLAPMPFDTQGEGLSSEREVDNPRPTRHVGRKFLSDGRVRPFAGNTIICHLPQQGARSEPFHALLDIYREAPRHAFMRKVTLLPTSSYHVTIFAGANDQERKPGLWPADLPLDLSMEACNKALAERLRMFHVGTSSGPRFRIDEATAERTPLTVNLVPVDADEDARLRRLRDDLSKMLGIRAVDHDSYQFHVTLGYTIFELSPAEQATFQDVYKAWRAHLAKRLSVIELGPPEFCVQDDMFAFHRQFHLAS